MVLVHGPHPIIAFVSDVVGAPAEGPGGPPAPPWATAAVGPRGEGGKPQKIIQTPTDYTKPQKDYTKPLKC